jgi:hypothetical protein
MAAQAEATRFERVLSSTVIGLRLVKPPRPQTWLIHSVTQAAVGEEIQRYARQCFVGNVRGVGLLNDDVLR